MANNKKKSELSRAFSEDGALKTHVGGQALIEGIMMRGKLNWAVAVRTPEGDIYTEEHDLAHSKKHAWMKWPFVRGCVALVQSLILGFKALEIAANHAYADDESVEDAEASGRVESADEIRSAAGERNEGCEASECSSPDALPLNEQDNLCSSSNAGSDSRGLRSEASQPSLHPLKSLPVSGHEGLTSNNIVGGSKPDNEEAKESSGEPYFGKAAMAISMVVGVALGVALFIVAPAFLTNLVVGEYDSSPVLWNVFDGLVRVAVFVAYIWLIGRMGDIKRMFSYHGAEHKTIHCFEHGLPLTPENARSFPRLHVRCGTAFLIMVMIIAIFVYTAIPLSALFSAWGVPDGAPKLALVIATRIIFMPLIAGISYEITVKWAGSHPENPLVKVILWPGLQMQRLTTNEPDDSMLECAIAAMQLVLLREENEKQSGNTAL